MNVPLKMTKKEVGRLGGRAKAVNFKKYEQIDSPLAKIANKEFYSFKGWLGKEI